MSRFSGRDWWFIGLLGTIYAFNFIDRMIIAVVGEPIRQEFGLSDFQLGIMGGAAFALFYGGIGIPLARLAERVNRIGIVATATALWSVMTILSGAATSYIHLLLARMGVGVGEAGFTPPVVSLIADRFPPERRATVFSMIAVGVSVGGAIGVLAGGWIAQTYGWRWAFVAAGAPGIGLALLLWLRATAAATHAFGQTAFGLGLGSAFLGWLSDNLARNRYGEDYLRSCVDRAAGVQTPECVEAAGTGLQQGLLILGMFLIIAIVCYLLAARSIGGEIRDIEGEI